MKTIYLLLLVGLFGVGLQAANLNLEGTYTCVWQSKTAKTFKGTLSSTGEGVYEGELNAPWDGRTEVYKGKVTGKPGSGSLVGDFIMSSTKRHFTFTINPSGGSYSGEAFENGKSVGVLTVKAEGGVGNSSGIDYSGLVAEAVSKNTSLSEETVLQIFKGKNVNKDDVIMASAASEITKGELAELYKKRKKVNTNFEFLFGLKLDKTTKKEIEELAKKIKAAMFSGAMNKK